jgi:hypothetical protein
MVLPSEDHARIDGRARPVRGKFRPLALDKNTPPSFSEQIFNLCRNLNLNVDISLSLLGLHGWDFR